jgi:hypothetical protein
LNGVPEKGQFVGDLRDLVAQSEKDVVSVGTRGSEDGIGRVGDLDEDGKVVLQGGDPGSIGIDHDLLTLGPFPRRVYRVGIPVGAGSRGD